jgi:nucleoid-associated protein YgaU
VAGVAVEDAGRLVVTGAASAGAFVNLYLNGSFLANVVAGKDGRWSVTVQHGMKGGAYAIRADEIDRAKDSVISRAEVPFNYPERVASQAVEQKPAPVAPIAPTPPSAPVPEPSKGAPSLAAASPSTPPATTPVPALAKGAPSAPVASMPVAAPTKAAPPAPTVRQPAEAAVATAAASAAAQPAPTAAAIGPNAANAIVRDVDTTKVVRGDSLWRISSQHYGNGVRYKQIYAANAAQIRNPRLIYPGQIFVLPQPTPF